MYIHYTNIKNIIQIDINPIVTPNHLWDPPDPATPTFEADAMGSDCSGPKKWITSTAVAGGGCSYTCVDNVRFLLYKNMYKNH